MENRYHTISGLNEQEGNTLIAFYPLTGRTHQLRVHAAHPEGLHCPIRGDELYGQKQTDLFTMLKV